MFSFVRVSDDDTVVVIINTSNKLLTTATVALPALDLQEGEMTFLDLLSEQHEEIVINEAGEMVFEFIEPYRVYILREDAVSSVSEVRPMQDMLEIYPNPASDQVQIVPDCGSERLHITVMDAMGRVAISREFPGTESTINLPLDKLAAGTYFITATGDNCSRSGRIVVQ